MNNENPFLHNKFADLGAVISASRPVLASHGLSVSQFPTSDGDRIGITTILMHSSGEWLEDTVLLMTEQEKGKSAAQVAGSIITYLRRYSWSAVLGLHSEEDTDGSGTGKKKAEQPSGGIVWTVAQKNALINAGLVKNDFGAKGMLGLSNLPLDAQPELIVKWGKAYRQVRPLEPDESSLSAKDAAERANKLFSDGAL